MINSLKTIAIFGCNFAGQYRQSLCSAFNTAAKELGVNLVYFNMLGRLGENYTKYGSYEYDLIDFISVDPFDGIIFDGEGYNVWGIADKVARKLKSANCPVVSISSYVDGFYNIEFDDVEGIGALIEHFINVHGYTRIGYMSGLEYHPDAQVRLAKFREVMKAHGLPEDGSGVFHGDFWYGKGEEAAEYFLSLPERPQAIVCANDYMAISLSTALKSRGLRIPEDIAVSGFDGTNEGQEYLPHISSATRERYDVAVKSLSLIIDLCEGREYKGDLIIKPKPVYTQSCGCLKLDYRQEAESITHVYDINRQFYYNLYSAESYIQKLSQIGSISDMHDIFLEASLNFGDVSSFFLMLHTDRSGKLSHDSDYVSPTGKFRAMLSVDKHNEFKVGDNEYSVNDLLPESIDDKPHSFYIMSTHCNERMFGYAAIEMDGVEVFNEFFTMWMLNMSTSLETMLRNDRLKKLIGTLEDLSIRDGLTGMLNRRGFDDLSRDAIKSIDGKATICTIVIDMDGLKHINDDHGHHEGDRAIKAAANIITKCCNAGEIAGRAGGDEFYIFAPEYSEKKLERFTEKLSILIESYNAGGNRPYKVEMSWGAYLCETDCNGRLEDMLKESDALMYEQKQAKPNRRK